MRKGSHHSQETKDKMSKAHKGRSHYSWIKGRIPWNKGKHCSEATKKILREKNLGKHLSEETKRKIGMAEKGHLTSEETRRKIGLANSIALKGKHHSEETKLKMSNAHKGEKNHNYGTHHSQETKRKISEGLKRRTKEQIRKCFQRRIPSSLENKFQGIIDKYFLPYKYVGNGKFFIERYNPDFININNEKIAIEVYATYYKLKNSIGIEEWKKQRAKVFKQYGWKIIFFNEIQVNENYVLEELNR